jgi:small subunit ribosomal protein S7
MPRAKQVKKRPTAPDPVYQSRLVSKLINKVMMAGKKSIAQKHVYAALKKIELKLKQPPLELLRQALDNAKPVMEVRSRRVGGAAYQVPSPVRGERREALAIRWIIQSARKRPNTQYQRFADKLAAELLDAAQNQGGAIEKKNQIHKMAEANKAFAHFRW